MKRVTFFLVAVAMAAALASLIPAFGQAGGQATPLFVTKMPPGYREWTVISVAHEAGNLNDLRALLGNKGRDYVFTRYAP